jgi:cellulose synthase/poly-beta-1,6-N-acetylglucosamine synthase-like glycosyltransferase
VTVVEVVFWVAIGLIVYTHVGYPLLLRALVGRRAGRKAPESVEEPSVSLIVAAHDEGDVIADKVRNMLALEYPGRLELIVASDGSTDETVGRSRDVKVLDLPRRGKVPTQDAAVDVAEGEILAFSDANAFWDAGALRELVRPFADPRVGYVCGQLSYVAPDGSNQEGLYWRYENWTRGLESRLASVTAGNGAIYAVRREAYMRLDPRTSHDLSFPFNMVKAGWRALYEPAARAVERPVPSVEGEFRRKRRMMSHAWPAVLGGGMLNPRGYGLTYGLEILSHRALRYATPFLHVIALAANVVLLGEGWVYLVTLAAQLALLLAAGLAPLNRRSRILALSRYYVLMTASLAAGLWDALRRGTPTTWEREPERPS